MKMYNSKGMIYIPESKKIPIQPEGELIVLTEGFCVNGHSLINSRVKFRKYSGLYFTVFGKNGRGFMALSPVWGEKIRLSIDIDLIDDELIDICCPTCGVLLPKYSPCDCGGDMVTVFLDKEGDYSNCIGICNRIGCPNSEIKSSDELLYNSRKHTL